MGCKLSLLARTGDEARVSSPLRYHLDASVRTTVPQHCISLDALLVNNSDNKHGHLVPSAVASSQRGEEGSSSSSYVSTELGAVRRDVGESDAEAAAFLLLYTWRTQQTGERDPFSSGHRCTREGKYLSQSSAILELAL